MICILLLGIFVANEGPVIAEIVGTDNVNRGIAAFYTSIAIFKFTAPIFAGNYQYFTLWTTRT